MDIKTVKNEMSGSEEFKPFISGYDMGYKDGHKSGKGKWILIGSILGFIGTTILEVVLKKKEIKKEYEKRIS